VFNGDATLGRYLGGFLLPVLIGNLAGGSILVAALNHAAVAHEQAEALAVRGQPPLKTRGPIIDEEVPA
jgi:hypothetical protein